MELKLEDAIGYTMEKTVKVLTKELQKAFYAAGHEITSYQFHILFKLWEEEGLFLTQLKNGAIVDSSTVTRNVDFLERHGYVQRQANLDEDRRKIRLTLTKNGRESRKVLMPAFLKHYERSRIGISDEELILLKEIAAKVRKNMRK
jgi:DNA-binding MarR family transcriptional regulator